MLPEPAPGRLGQQLGQRPARNQQVAGAGAREQCVMQHPQEDLRAGLRRRRVQRRHAQRVEDLGAHPRRQAGGELRHRPTRVAAKAPQQPAQRGRAQRQPLRQPPVPHRPDRTAELEQRRARPQPQPHAVLVEQRQRLALQHRVGIDADAAHQPERGGVGADQDVLAVVEPVGRIAAGRALGGQAARAPAGLRRHLEDRHRVAGLDRGDRCRQPGPARADDGDAAHRPRQLVFIAIQSLRTGVSEMRWCSTWNSVASISRSSVR